MCIRDSLLPVPLHVFGGNRQDLPCIRRPLPRVVGQTDFPSLGVADGELPVRRAFEAELRLGLFDQFRDGGSSTILSRKPKISGSLLLFTVSFIVVPPAME